MAEPSADRRTSKPPLPLCSRYATARSAIDFYKAAFGAVELFRTEGEDGSVVAQLSVGASDFWVADEAPEHQNFSPATLGGSTVRMVMVVEDPDAVFDRAVAAGANWTLARRRPALRLAHWPRRRSLRASLGDR